MKNVKTIVDWNHSGIASGTRKRSYTCEEVLNLVINDSDSDALNVGYDSDISDGNSERSLIKDTASKQSVTPAATTESTRITSESGNFMVVCVKNSKYNKKILPYLFTDTNVHLHDFSI